VLGLVSQGQNRRQGELRVPLSWDKKRILVGRLRAILNTRLKHSHASEWVCGRPSIEADTVNCPRARFDCGAFWLDIAIGEAVRSRPPWSLEEMMLGRIACCHSSGCPQRLVAPRPVGLGLTPAR